MLSAILGIFCFIMWSVVCGRWAETLERYKELSTRGALSASPESLAVRRSRLTLKANALRLELDNAAGAYGRTFAGLLAEVSRAAGGAKVKLKSVTPLEEKGKSASAAQAFKIECRGEYHGIGLFVNRIENSPFDIHVNRVAINRGVGRGNFLESTIGGRFVAAGDLREHVLPAKQ